MGTTHRRCSSTHTQNNPPFRPQPVPAIALTRGKWRPTRPCVRSECGSLPMARARGGRSTAPPPTPHLHREILSIRRPARPTGKAREPDTTPQRITAPVSGLRRIRIARQSPEPATYRWRPVMYAITAGAPERPAFCVSGSARAVCVHVGACSASAIAIWRIQALLQTPHSPHGRIDTDRQTHSAQPLLYHHKPHPSSAT